MSILPVAATVLFVGHSLIGPQLPGLVEAALRAGGHVHPVEAQVINGSPLSWNWDHSAEAEGVDGRAVLARGGVGALVLTEGLPLAFQITWNDTAGQIAQWGKAARAASPEARIYLLETWHDLDSGTPVDGDPNSRLSWRERLDADLPAWEQAAAAASAQLGGAPVQLIPAGQAMARMADAIARGEVPGLTSPQDLFEDKIHPNAKGLYFVAMVNVAALTGASPEGLPAKLTRTWASRDAVISDELAAVMQRIAWEAVSGYKSPSPEALAVVEQAQPVQAAVAEPATAPPPPPAANAALPDGLTPITNPSLAMNLAGVNDWTVEQPFLDVMKTARPWIGHLPGQWGGWGHDELAKGGYLDAEGWPKAMPPELSAIATVMLTDLPPDAGGIAGRYLLRYEGQGNLSVGGRGQVVQSIPGRVLFDFTPGEGPVIVTIDRIDPADPIRRITVVREDRAGLLDAGQIFNPDFLTRMRGVKMLRFMDWMATNGSPLVSADQLPQAADYTWARVGVPMAAMVALANELQADAWFNVPHKADDGLARALAEAARDGLAPGRRAWVEYSNEVWNWGFEQAHWADEQGKTRWGDADKAVWMQFYGHRAAEIADIWADAFGAEAPDRLVRVITTQTGWKGLEEALLTSPPSVAEGRPMPATRFDAYAVTGYFGGSLGSEAGAALVKGWLEQTGSGPGNYDGALKLAARELRDGSLSGSEDGSLKGLRDLFAYQAQVASAYGLDLVMYEGGSHAAAAPALNDDVALNGFLSALNYSPEMGELYEELLADWARVSAAPFAAYNDIAAPSKWGGWGALRHLADENPRWQALAKGCGTC